MKTGKSIIMGMFLLTSILLSTIAYSAFSTQLQIKGEAILRSKNDIRITGLKKIEYSSGVYETYSNKYSKDTVSFYVTLPANTSITYEVAVTNNNDSDYTISKITQQSHNSNVSYSYSFKVNDDTIDKKSTKTFTIKITNITSSTQVETLVLKYTFEKCNYVNLADYLKSLATSSTIIKDDGTSDHNMRYTGISPNNYVTFAGEEWRVIGAFNNIDNGASKKETRVKLIKADSIGNNKWHSTTNIWKNATLNSTLQGKAYASNAMVENAIWYLGDSGNAGRTAAQFYQDERGTTVATGNDTTWTGKIGLMYPSDYGFASSSCKNGSQTLSNYNNSTCTETNWLFLGASEWLMTPVSSNSNSTRYINTGYVKGYNTTGSFAVRPTVYLKSNVKCTNCNDSTAGTQSNPFKIA